MQGGLQSEVPRGTNLEARNPGVWRRRLADRIEPARRLSECVS